MRSLTQPRGTPVPEFTLAGQNSILAQKLGDAVAALQASQPQLDRLTNGAARLDDGLHALSTGARAITSGSGRIASGGGELRDGLATASTSSTRLADGADRLADGSKQLADGVDTAAKPLFALLNSISPPGPCPDGHCDPSGLAVLAADNSTLGQIRYQLTRLYTGARQLADGNTRLAAGIGQLRSGLRDAARGSTTLAAGQNLLTDKLTELTHGAQDAHAGTQQLAAGVRQIRPQMQQLLDGLRQAHDILAASGTATGPDAGFFVPQSAFTDPRYTPALRYFLSADGHSARLMVVDRDSAYSPGAPDRVGALTMAVRTALAGTSLQHAHISATGLAAGFADLHTLVLRDFALIAACALICIAVILAVLLRALLAPLYMLITIALSYAAALGLTVLIWQDLFGIDIYWAVPPLAFIALVAVGSDYNIMVMSRIREESTDDFRTGIVRAVSSTGGVVSTAGVIFALTMLAMLASPTHSIGQVGSTIGCGLLLDTFLVRAFTVPAIAALFGHANWWPARRARQTPAPSAQPTTEHTTPIEAI